MKYLFPSPWKFISYLETNLHSKNSQPLCIPKATWEKLGEQKFKSSPQKGNPLATEGEEGLKLECGYEVVTGSEQILKVFQISFPVSR